MTELGTLITVLAFAAVIAVIVFGRGPVNRALRRALDRIRR